MNYAQAIEFLHGLQVFGAQLGLENTRRLAALAGNPQEKLRFLHVAGTNGKGSTCALLESIYRTAGLRVGLFTSPHLVSFRERIQVNRQFIPESELVRRVEEIQTRLRQFPDNAHPTLFEVTTVLALQYFAAEGCDLVIWETGLGGRLDATNIVTPLASVITNIALDHQSWLGDTLEKIAAEKAGILKPGIPGITGTDAPEALRVIEATARKIGAPLTRVRPDPDEDESMRPALWGKHQRQNAALARATVEALQPQIPVTQEQIRTGLATVRWPGRLQRVQGPHGQRILLDGAHNVAGAEALRAALTDRSELHPSDPEMIVPAAFIVGFLGDKEWQSMCGILAPLAAKVFTVPVASERTAAAGDLAAAFQAARPGAEVVACSTLAEALAAARGEPFLVITGSLYLVGEALEQLGLSPAETGERALNEWSARR